MPKFTYKGFFFPVKKAYASNCCIENPNGGNMLWCILYKTLKGLGGSPNSLNCEKAL
jgi:hypothetical protein